MRCRMLRGARCGGGPGTFGPSLQTLGGSASRPFAEFSLTATVHDMDALALVDCSCTGIVLTFLRLR